MCPLYRAGQRDTCTVRSQPVLTVELIELQVLAEMQCIKATVVICGKYINLNKIIKT